MWACTISTSIATAFADENTIVPLVELGECAAGDGVQFQSALARQIELR